jgi:sigma-E factor negative regulatory protein RseB
MGIARTALALSLVAALCPVAHATPEEARTWLARMSDALATREYDGLFTHSNRRQSETMRIVHRMEGANSVERLVSLDGSGREIVRTPREVHAYLPDRRVVLVEPRTDDGSLLKALPTPGAELDAQYLLEVRGGSRLLGRNVRIIEIRPRDGYRYGYRLWLDEKSAMPLRSEICDQTGRPVERIQFTKLDMHTNMPASETEPSVDASGFRWVRSARPGSDRRVAVAAASWRALKVPPGFRLVGSRVQSLPGHPMPVQHLVFSDGFASVSVFIEPGSRNAPAPAEASRMGAASTFTTTVRGYMITAVGEVPPTTVRDIATSLAPVADAAVSPPPAR